jgi:hypothetical protein
VGTDRPGQSRDRPRSPSRPATPWRSAPLSCRLSSPFLPFPTPDPWTLTPTYAMLYERAHYGRKAMALQRLSTSFPQNQPGAGTLRACPPRPRARLAIVGAPMPILELSRFRVSAHNARVLGLFTPAPAVAVPIPDSRPTIPERMGFPPGTFFACTHGVSSRPPAVAVPPPSSPPPLLRVWPFLFGQTRLAFPSCSLGLTPFPLPTLGEGALAPRQVRLHRLGVRSSRHDDQRSGITPIPPRPVAAGAPLMR